MDKHNQLNTLIEDIYSAALTTDDPTPLLGRIAGFLGYEVCTLTTARSRYTQASCDASWGMDPAICERAERDFGASFICTKLNGREVRAGEFGFFDEYVSVADLRSLPVFHEIVVPHRLQEGVKICLEHSPERTIFINFMRPVPGADRNRQREILGTLTPHWTRATQIFLKLGQVDMLRQAYTETANLAPFAMVIFDNTGAVYLANNRAEQSLRSDGLALLRDGMHAARDNEHQRLQQAIQAAITSSNSGRRQCSTADMRISRPSGRRSYQVLVTSMSPAAQRWGQRPAAAVAVFDPDEELTGTFERCRDIFGLTRAEAQVALGIMHGRSLGEIASSQGKAIATSRNLLKRVYMKTGVNRQNELAWVMMNSPLLLPNPRDSQPARQH